MRQQFIFKTTGNNNPMKNQHFVLVALMLLLFIIFSFSACNIYPLSVPNDIYNSVVRIHIRANSNNDIDQEVKLKVRDEITAYLGDILGECKNKNDALCAIKDNVENLTNIANSTLNRNNFAYSSSVYVNKSYFPERHYDQYVFPEGEYDALIIELGSGKGDNWWCVAFPPLCFVPDSGEDEIVYKSWVKEILDKIFG